MKLRIMRLMRLKHGVSLAELSRAVSRSPQYFSSIELGEYPPTDGAKQLVATAFDSVAKARADAVSEFQDDYAENREKLLDFIEE